MNFFVSCHRPFNLLRVGGWNSKLRIENSKLLYDTRGTYRDHNGKVWKA